MKNKISLEEKFNPEMLFSAEEGAYIELNRLQKQMNRDGGQEPSTGDLLCVVEAETLIEIDKGLLLNDVENYVGPQFFFWNRILDRIEGESYVEFFHLVIVPAFTFLLLEIPEYMPNFFDESNCLGDREWATECLTYAYQLLNTQDKERIEVRDRFREQLWTDDYARNLFKYIQ
ncbi:hypothetical protein [Collinsella aerofaciens]|uniref:hypothetical protein n=1 Tax=Collinsella aerofaciens TaxID=74426 RepID=UPI0034A31564